MSLEDTARALVRQSKAAGRRRRRTRGQKIERLETHEEVNLTLEQLADYWNVAVQTLRKWIRVGHLPGFRVGRAMRVRRADALAYERREHLKTAG